MPEFVRSRHQLVWQVLEALNQQYLSDCKCFFGGGTRIVLELGEYRESLDVDFLCANRKGYRSIRNTISSNSFGQVFSGSYELMRDIRADMYGVRTFVRAGSEPLKFEIVSEGRIELSGMMLPGYPVEVLDRESCIAEKLLAHADRGRDASTNSRDLIDLAFMAANWSSDNMAGGYVMAEHAYGDTVTRELRHGLGEFSSQVVRQRCVEALGICDTDTMDAGLERLKNYRI